MGKNIWLCMFATFNIFVIFDGQFLSHVLRRMNATRVERRLELLMNCDYLSILKDAALPIFSHRKYYGVCEL